MKNTCTTVDSISKYRIDTEGAMIVVSSIVSIMDTNFLKQKANLKV